MRLVAFGCCRPFLSPTVVLVIAGVGLASDRIDHLLKAAAHLEQAGYSDKAAEIREIAERESLTDRQRLLQQKTEQIRQLQAEVEQLRLGIESSPRILLRLKVLSFSPLKLKNMGVPLVSIRNLLESDTSRCLVDETGSVVEFIDFLQEQGLITAVCEPAITTAAGRMASICIGQQCHSGQAECNVVGVKTLALGDCGIRFDCTANITEDGEFDLAIKLRQAEPTQADPGDGTDTNEAANAKSFDIEARARVESAQRVILCSRRHRDDPAKETVVLIVLSAELAQVGTR